MPKCSFGLKDITLKDVFLFSFFAALLPFGLVDDWLHRKDTEKMIQEYRRRHAAF